MRNKKIYIFIGTTAELIKLIPVIKELKKQKQHFTLITSGQTEILLHEFKDYIGTIDNVIQLKGKIQKSSLIYFIIWAIKTMFGSPFFLRKEFKGLNKKNSYFIIHGDTVSSLIGAFLAYFYRLNIVHVESGLRSFNFLEPFPEEICRYIISHVADIHFSPNDWSVNNLKNHKGIKINTEQNTVLESFWMALDRKKQQKRPKELKEKYFVLVMHRQEHVLFRKAWSKKMFEFIIENSPKDLQCVFIIHDITASFLKSIGYAQKGYRIVRTPRLPYISFIHLMRNAEFVITDGGSNQEELYYLGKPCLILRNNTERIEGLGENALLSKSKPEAILNFFTHYKQYKRQELARTFYPSKVIVDYLVTH